ncbi:MarC family protein [Streptomyces sp. NBC_01767]|uniref:MarC family protein n=1 Tax=unclassified Streptomyces TaxID=2593676 RepID=UPI00225A146C|nr:MarC family protein [Streptomyces sp. NBC_01767]MCX4391745.1 MarC family protein [Streptomyces sp. NBC_01767]WSX05981.1 MarC family protein [Streptomyces sp. NBC_00987]
MNALTFSAALITFVSVVGPPKVLISFAHLAELHPTRQLRTIAFISCGVAVFIGLVASLTAPLLLDLFHISTPALLLAGGIIFFLYAVGLVLGIPTGMDAPDQDAPDVTSGLRELLVPFVVSPLAMTALLIEATARSSWTWRSTVAGAYVAVILLDLVCILLLERVLRATHHATIELLGRLLGLLLAAVSIDLVLDGLAELGVGLSGRDH